MSKRAPAGTPNKLYEIIDDLREIRQAPHEHNLDTDDLINLDEAIESIEKVTRRIKHLGGGPSTPKS